MLSRSPTLSKNTNLADTTVFNKAADLHLLLYYKVVTLVKLIKQSYLVSAYCSLVAEIILTNTTYNQFTSCVTFYLPKNLKPKQEQ